MFKVNNGNTRTRCEICSKVAKKTLDLEMKKVLFIARLGYLKEQQRLVASKTSKFVEVVNLTKKNQENSVMKMI